MRQATALAACGRLIFIAAVLCLGSAPGRAAETTLSQQHWAYQAIDGWARRGLLAGYPAGPLTGPKQVTRFEIASLTLRAVEGIGQQYQQQGRLIAQLAVPAEAPTPSAQTTAPETAPPPPSETTPSAAQIQAVERAPGVYAEDIAMLEKLVAEFRTELAGMGARVEELRTALETTRRQLAQVQEEVRRHQISGYVQFRFSDDQGAEASTFSVRRARLNIAGPLSPKVAYRLQLQLDHESGEEVALRDAYLDLVTSRHSRLRAGQAKLPIGYELPESSADRLEPERALVMDRLFPDQRDIGVQWHYWAGPGRPGFDAAVVNGTGINVADDNDRKDVLAAVYLPFHGGSATLAAYDGRSGRGLTAQEKDRLAAGVELIKNGTHLRGEYVTGRDLGEDVVGWYARLSQQATRRGTLYVKYDTFDENTDRPDDLFRRWSVGWVEELDARTRLTLHWETRRVGRLFSEYDDFHGDAAIAQLQVRF